MRGLVCALLGCAAISAPARAALDAAGFQTLISTFQARLDALGAAAAGAPSGAGSPQASV